jgi:hypothetical protein
MWVLVALWVTGRRRLAVNVVLVLMATFGVSGVVAGPGQIYLRFVDPTSPHVYPAPLWAPYLATLGGVVLLILVAVVIAERADRRAATPPKVGGDDTIPARLSYGEVYCPRCDTTFVGDADDPEARTAYLAHFERPPHTVFGRWRG